MWKLTYKLRKSADGLSPVWKGILTQSFTARKLSNQKSTANIVSTTRKTTLCWLQAKIKELRSFISIDILNYISVWRSGRNEEGERRVIPPPPPLCCFSFCSLFFSPSPSSERLHGAGYCGATRLWPQERRTPKLWLSYSREQTGRDHCTVCQILSLTDQIISSLTINIKSLSYYWSTWTTSTFQNIFV